MPCWLRYRSVAAQSAPLNSHATGFGMIEFMVALTIFSAGMLGLLSAQLSGQRSIQAALDRSLATSLAADLLVRIELNAGEAAHYAAQTLSAVDHPPSNPPIDCYHMPCAPSDLVVFDWWDWSRQLIFSGNAALPEARVCVTYSENTATVSISWRGLNALLAVSPDACEEGEGGAGEEGAWRRHVMLSTYTGAS
ncbi:MAG: type IV pilus assembly protein PilV [Bacteroidia bacterium]|jgi:type IV pilus assembly protein PilV